MVATWSFGIVLVTFASPRSSTPSIDNVAKTRANIGEYVVSGNVNNGATADLNEIGH